MKFSSSTIAAAVLALGFSSVNAATISNSNVIISILNSSTTESMLIDTQIAASSFVNGTVTSWTSNADLTAAISGFISGASSIDFWTAGTYKSGFDTFGLSNTTITPTIVGDFNTDIGAFIGNANSTTFVGATEGLSENWVAGITAGENGYYTAQNLLGTGWVTSIASGVDAPFFGSQFGFGTQSEFVLESWNLAADGSLTYGVSAVPVPAAVWLFGSGLIGLVGIARRRKA